MKDALRIVGELERSVSLIRDADADRLSEAIGSSRKVFLAGAGRTGLMGKAFGMRLMQLGYEAYVVGETTTPAIAEGDLLLVGSGSGETKSLAAMAQKAKSVGAAVAVVTIHPGSTIGLLADIVVQLPGAAKDHGAGHFATIQPMASLFEQTLLVFYDATVLGLMRKHGADSSQMFTRHANLE
jgi:6-phospho-3-hexuloisomerase